MKKILNAFLKHKAFNTFTNIILILVYIYFLHNHIIGIRNGSISNTTYVFILMESVVLFLLILRSNPKVRSDKPLAWICAFLGTALPLFLKPSGITTNPNVGNILLLTGGILAIISYLSLNTSFGISPALRKVKTNGLYKIIRHPMYASYLVLHVGYLQISYSLLNIFIIVTTFIFLLIRINFEEALLSEDKSYQEYRKKVKYRLLPYIF